MSDEELKRKFSIKTEKETKEQMIPEYVSQNAVGYVKCDIALKHLKQREKHTRQNTFDIMKSNSTCKYQGDILRVCFAKGRQVLVKNHETGLCEYEWKVVESVESLECCLERCPLFNGGVL